MPRDGAPVRARPETAPRGPDADDRGGPPFRRSHGVRSGGHPQGGSRPQRHQAGERLRDAHWCAHARLRSGRALPGRRDRAAVRCPMERQRVRYGRLHRPRANSWPARDTPKRSLLARRRPLRDAHRREAVQRCVHVGNGVQRARRGSGAVDAAPSQLPSGARADRQQATGEAAGASLHLVDRGLPCASTRGTPDQSAEAPSSFTASA